MRFKSLKYNSVVAGFSVISVCARKKHYIYNQCLKTTLCVIIETGMVLFFMVMYSAEVNKLYYKGVEAFIHSIFCELCKGSFQCLPWPLPNNSCKALVQRPVQRCWLPNCLVKTGHGIQWSVLIIATVISFNEVVKCKIKLFTLSEEDTNIFNFVLKANVDIPVLTCFTSLMSNIFYFVLVAAGELLVIIFIKLQV